MVATSFPSLVMACNIIWDVAPSGWFEQDLRFISASCKGISIEAGFRGMRMVLVVIDSAAAAVIPHCGAQSTHSKDIAIKLNQ